MKFMTKARIRQYWRQYTMVAGFAVVGALVAFFALADSPNASVDFTKATTTLATKPFSSTISTYGENNTDIINSASQRSALANLKAGYYRIPLQWNGGNIVSSAGGHPAGSGDAWVNSIKNIGAEPQIVVGGSADNNFTPDEAANLVRHFNKPTTGSANPVNVWVIGNEPGNGGMSIQTYCDLFNATAAKMKAVDPTIKVAGPAWAYFDSNTINTFLQCAGNNVDIIDFHHYAMGGSFLSEATALAQTGDWESEVTQTKQAIAQYVPSRANQIEVQVGEYNWSWRAEDGYNGWQGDDRFYQSVNTVWGASVAGHIAKAGGRGHQYSDLNGPLGLTFEKTDAASHYGRKVTDPLPIYYGMEMFTGGTLFRGFGTSMVDASTTLNNVEIYASNNGKNIVVVNKDPQATQPLTLKLTGFGGGSADVWQTSKDAPFDAPVKKTTINNVNDLLSYGLPPYSVTTFVLNDGQVTATPPPTPTYSCDSLSAQLGADQKTYTFTTGASAVNGATISGYSYTFGDQTVVTAGGKTIQHAYAPGTYTASVTVTFAVNGSQVPVSSQNCRTTVMVAQPTAPTPTQLTVPVRINAGGTSYTDTSGNKWLADVDYSGGATDNQAKGRTIAGTNDAALYQDERWGNFSYHLPVVNGTYTLKLHFAEIYDGCAKSGCRVFTVNINGKPWLTNFDIAAKVGANKADTEEATVTVTQNALDISFVGVAGSPQLAALELLTPVTTTPTPPSTPQPNTNYTAIKGIAGKCVDNRYNTKANGNKIQLYTCNATDAQKWALQSNGTIKNANGYCLDAQRSGTAPGTIVQLYECNNTDAQVWKVNAVNHSIVNVHANLCLDDYRSRTGNGTQIQLYTCNATDAQKWDFTN
ncbi:MAG TPA: malectin domain-containing carbohydrate-binding protein [Candidatus Saccharimonadales bacterium]|nr:malectin domain-containing carbohydrate-binding protein [Candidatus Saccharimonadales bacterium]